MLHVGTCIPTADRWPHAHQATKPGTRKSMQTFLCNVFKQSLRVMDVHAKNHGRQHSFGVFPVAPVTGRNFLTAGLLSMRLRNVRRKSEPTSACLCSFSSLTSYLAVLCQAGSPCVGSNTGPSGRIWRWARHAAAGVPRRAALQKLRMLLLKLQGHA